jgi:protease PrsW
LECSEAQAGLCRTLFEPADGRERRVFWFMVAVLFALAWVWAFYREDRLEREPVWLVGAAFLWGMLGLLPALLLERWLLPNGLGIEDPLATRIVGLFLVVGPVEELCKFAGIRLHLYRHAQFNEPMDGIVYGVTAATGFALAENLHFMDGAPEVILARGPGATLAHILFAGFWGAALGWARQTASRLVAWRIMFVGLLWAVVTHGLFDLIIFSVDKELPAIVARLALATLLIASYLILRYQMKLAHAHSPFLKP